MLNLIQWKFYGKPGKRKFFKIKKLFKVSFKEKNNNRF